MNTPSDQQLLRDYAERRSEPAFAELVRRHIDLVHSAALRRVGDPHLAQDVTQSTFAALAQNARTLADHPVLSGWLHRTTQNLATNLIRTNTRRQSREQEAATMTQLLSPSPEANWQDIAPQLDAAFDELEADDRDAVLLRYFEKKSAHEMATQLGISDDAAQKRVSRAVERLRELIAKRGVTVGASALVAVVTANAVQAAPVGLALTISTAIALTGPTLATTATVTATKALAMTALQKTIVTATIVVLAGVAIYEARQASTLRQQIRALQTQQASLAAQLQRLSDTNQPIALPGNSSPRSDLQEVLRLRATVARLRREADELSAAAREAMTFQARVLDVLSNTPPVRTFVATAVADLPWDHTVATGGWKTPDGKRAFVFATVRRGEGAGQVNISSTVIEYTEAGARESGFSGFYDENTQTPKGTFTLDAKQTADVLQHAQDPERASVTSGLAVTTINGRMAEVQTVELRQIPSGEKYTTGPIINFIPTVAADGESVQIVMTAQLSYRIPLPTP